MARHLTLLICLALLGLAAWRLFAAREGPRDGPAPLFDVEKGDFQLDPDVARRVWNIETVAHRLQMEAVPKLIEAWDGDAFPPFFADAFTAEVPGEHERIAHGPVTVRRGRKGTTRVLNAREWFAYLRKLGKPPRAGPSLVAFHVDLLSPAPDGEGWTGTWTVRLWAERAEYVATVEVDYLRIAERPAEDRGWIRAVRTVREELRRTRTPLMRDITASSGIAVRELFDSRVHGGGAAFHPVHAVDYDGDGRLDVLILDKVDPKTQRMPGQRCYLYRNLGDGTFQDVTLESGLAAAPPRQFFRQAVVGDFDNDGDDDLLFELGPQSIGVPVAYRNEKGRFIRTPTNLPGVPLGNAAIADFDRDGLLDLYLPNSGKAVAGRDGKARWIGDRTGPEGLLLRGLGGFRFEDVTDASNAGGGNREVLGAHAVDLEPDGDADLILANHMGENALLVNDGKGRFEERPFADPFGGFSMGVATGDLDGDLDPDFYVANMSSRAGLRIMSNVGEAAYPAGVFPLLIGWIDGNEILRNDNAAVQLVARDTAGWAYGPATVDLDGDGRLDVYCPVGYQSVDPHAPDG